MNNTDGTISVIGGNNTDGTISVIGGKILMVPSVLLVAIILMVPSVILVEIKLMIPSVLLVGIILMVPSVLSDGIILMCSGRLTLDVFVRNLTYQLGTPSHWLPVDSCKEGQKGVLAAVCTPTLKSASKKHQNSTPPYRSTVNGTLKVVKRNCV